MLYAQLVVENEVSKSESTKPSIIETGFVQFANTIRKETGLLHIPDYM